MASKDLIRMTEGALDNMIVEAVNYDRIGGTHFLPRCSSTMMVDTFNHVVWRRKAPKEITICRIKHWLFCTECAFLFATGYKRPITAKLLTKGYGVFGIKGVRPKGSRDDIAAEGIMALNVKNDKDFYKNCCTIAEKSGHDSFYHKPLDSDSGYLVNVSDNQHGTPDTFIKDVFLDYLSLLGKDDENSMQQNREQVSYEGEPIFDCNESISQYRQFCGLTRQAIQIIAKEIE